MHGLNHKPNPQRFICAETLEKLIGEGKTQKEAVRMMNLDPSFLSARINNSASLAEAVKRGKEKRCKN